MARDSARQVIEVELKLEFDPADDAAYRLSSRARRMPRAAGGSRARHHLFRHAGLRVAPAGRLSADSRERRPLCANRQDRQEARPISSSASNGSAKSRAARSTLTGWPAVPWNRCSRPSSAPRCSRYSRRACGAVSAASREDGAEIEVAIDVGEIATRSHTLPISELELELKRGDKAALFRLARRLAETVPFRLELKTKAERGYELLQDGGAPGGEGRPDRHPARHGGRGCVPRHRAQLPQADHGQ